MGANINAITNYGFYLFYSETALLFACQGNQSAMVILLLKYGCDVRICDEEKNSPLHYASWSSDNVVIMGLINAGAEINSMDARKNNSLLIKLHSIFQ